MPENPMNKELENIRYRKAVKIRLATIWEFVKSNIVFWGFKF